MNNKSDNNVWNLSHLSYFAMMGRTWEKFSSLPAKKKKKKNLKPQPERKTFRQKRRVALVGDNLRKLPR